MSMENIELGCLPIAMAYVPMQHYCDLYDDETALLRGTMFKELDKPFLGGDRYEKR